MKVLPAAIPSEKICWRAVSGTALFPNGTNGTEVAVRGVDGMVDIEIGVLNATDERMHFRSKVIQ